MSSRGRRDGEAAGRRRRGEGHRLRDLVVEVTSELLAEVGDVEALTMRDVATAAGVTAPSVYRHFPDKEALVRTVVTLRFAELAEALRTAGAGTSSPLERLRSVASAYVGYGLGHPGHYRVLFSAANAGPEGLGTAGVAEHPGAASYEALVAAVDDCLPRRRRAGSRVLAVELWASLHGIVDLRITKPELPWPEPSSLVQAALVPVEVAAAKATPAARRARRAPPGP